MVFSFLLRDTFTRHGKVSKLTLLIWLDVNGLLRNTFTRHGKVSKLTLLIWLDVNGP